MAWSNSRQSIDHSSYSNSGAKRPAYRSSTAIINSSAVHSGRRSRLLAAAWKSTLATPYQFRREAHDLSLMAGVVHGYPVFVPGIERPTEEVHRLVEAVRGSCRGQAGPEVLKDLFAGRGLARSGRQIEQERSRLPSHLGCLQTRPPSTNLVSPRSKISRVGLARSASRCANLTPRPTWPTCPLKRAQERNILDGTDQLQTAGPQAGTMDSGWRRCALVRPTATGSVARGRSEAPRPECDQLGLDLQRSHRPCPEVRACSAAPQPRGPAETTNRRR